MPNVDINLSSLVSQIGVETTEGVAVPATHQYHGVSFQIQPQGESETIRPEGYKYPTDVTPNKEWTETELMITPDYQSMALLFNLLKVVTPINVNGTAYSWELTPDTKNEDKGITLTLEKGSIKRTQRSRGNFLTEFGLSVTRDKVEMNGKVKGYDIEDNIGLSPVTITTLTITGIPTGGNFTLLIDGVATTTIAYNASASVITSAIEGVAGVGVGNVIVNSVGSLPTNAQSIKLVGTAQGKAITAGTNSLTGGTSPTIGLVDNAGTAIEEVPIIPILPSHCDVYLDDTAGAIGTTQIDRGFSISVKLGSIKDALWALKSSKPSFSATVESVPSPDFEIILGADNEGMALLQKYRTNAPVFVRVKFEGLQIVGSTERYTLIIDLAVKLKSPTEFTDEQGLVLGAKYTGTLVHSSELTKAFNMFLIDSLATI